MANLRCLPPLQTYCRWALYRRACTATSSFVNEDSVPQISTNPTGWSPPTGRPAPPGVKPDIPFRVRRSKHHQLPVYLDYKKGRTLVLTKISKIDGDIKKMEAMIREQLDLEHVHMRVDAVTGSIVLVGNHRLAMIGFLKRLGF